LQELLSGRASNDGTQRNVSAGWNNISVKSDHQISAINITQPLCLYLKVQTILIMQDENLFLLLQY
jgi:hypothetical protein